MISILIYCHVTFLLDNLLCLVAIVLYYVLCSIIILFIPLSNYKCFLAKLTSIFVFHICLNSLVSMFGNLCFDLASKFEMVNEQNYYGTDVEQFKGQDKRFILHCVRFRSG